MSIKSLFCCLFPSDPHAKGYRSLPVEDYTNSELKQRVEEIKQKHSTRRKKSLCSRLNACLGENIDNFHEAVDDLEEEHNAKKSNKKNKWFCLWNKNHTEKKEKKKFSDLGGISISVKRT